MNTLDKLDRILNRKITATTFYNRYKQGDCLYIDTLRFTMSHYSMEAVGKNKQLSRFIEYVGYGLTIALDMLLDTIVIQEN